MSDNLIMILVVVPSFIVGFFTIPAIQTIWRRLKRPSRPSCAQPRDFHECYACSCRDFCKPEWTVTVRGDHRMVEAERERAAAALAGGLSGRVEP